jgi:AcrR family transcriptional regulator
MDEPDRLPPSLAQDQQQLTRSRIRRAAMEVVAQRGYDATVDEIAQLSGVSPRTIFRHYQSHDVLIAATVKDMFEAGARPIENLPSPADDLDGWLETLAVAAHTRNVEILGNAFWDLHAQKSKMSAILTELGAFRREYRRKAMRSLTALAWRSAGGIGEPPEDLVLAFALNFSAFTTQALTIDFDQTPAQIGVITAEIVKMLLRRAVDSQRSAGGDGAREVDAGHG